MSPRCSFACAITTLALMTMGGCDREPADDNAAPALIRAADIIAAEAPDFILSNEDHAFGASRYLSACWLDAVSQRLPLSHFGAETFSGRGPAATGAEPDLIARASIYARYAHFEDLFHTAARHALVFVAYDHREITGEALEAQGLVASPFNRRAAAGAATLLSSVGPDGRAFVHTGPGHPDRRWGEESDGRRGWLGAQLDQRTAGGVVSIANNNTEFPNWAQSASTACPDEIRLEDSALLVDLQADTLRCAARSSRPRHEPLFDIYAVDARLAGLEDPYTKHSVRGCAVRRVRALATPQAVNAQYRVVVRQTDALGRLTVTWRAQGEPGRPQEALVWPDREIQLHWYWIDSVTGERRSALETYGAAERQR